MRAAPGTVRRGATGCKDSRGSAPLVCAGVTNPGSHIPTLETERLVLRPLSREDLPAYADFVTSERSCHMGGPHPERTAWDWLVNDTGHWALFGFGGLAVTRNDAIVGQVSVTQGVDFPEPELGWFLLDGNEGRGYATEAARALKAHVCGAGSVETLVSYIAPRNDRSIRVARALGARPDSTAARPEGSGCLVYRHEVAA